MQYKIEDPFQKHLSAPMCDSAQPAVLQTTDGTQSDQGSSEINHPPENVNTSVLLLPCETHTCAEIVGADSSSVIIFPNSVDVDLYHR